ncbi:MAG: phenylacetate--CoA ligase family protein, partial [Rhodospirillaceae bacterium]|nr:phenylacetate--CoA ligase family protein [Rhodospirillaceae bacterium]
MTTGDFYDELETRSTDAREQALLDALPGQISHAKANATYFGKLFADIDPTAITSRQALASLPVTRKSDLIELQKETPPLGGLIATEPGKLRRIYQSPGPIYDTDGHSADWWRTARALYAAGFRAGDIM